MEAATALGLLDSDPAGALVPARDTVARCPLPAFDLRCSGCGYGVVVRIAPESCPMCAGTTWEHPPRPRRPRSRHW